MKQIFHFPQDFWGHTVYDVHDLIHVQYMMHVLSHVVCIRRSHGKGPVILLNTLFTLLSNRYDPAGHAGE